MDHTEIVRTVECPKCRLKNLAGTKFCADCGTPLVSGVKMICTKCSHENPPGTKFCGNCGASFELNVESDPDIHLLQRALKGRYVVQKSLGEGGFGRVFLALHEGLKRKDVIKLLGADQSRSEDIKRRFLQEAQAIAKLSHPNIIEIKDVAEFEGRPYYIMSYREGGSLEDLLQKEKKLSPERAIELCKGILSALSEIHAKGIIHRDIKPDNVLIGDKGEAILIDFGIARVEEDSTLKPKTGTGMTIGTVTYMSPEQLEGKSIDSRSDLYSTGILLYELLVGEPPFQGSLPSLILKHTTEEVPGITDKLNNHKFAPNLEYVIKKACEKKAEDRFGNALEMRDAFGLETTEIPVEQKQNQKPNSEVSDKNIKDNAQNLGTIIKEEFPFLTKLYYLISGKFIKLPIYGRILVIIFSLFIGNKFYGIFKPWGPYMGQTSWGYANMRCWMLGMRLPSKDELKDAYNNGETESWQKDTKDYWSSTPYGSEGLYFFNVYNGKSYYVIFNIYDYGVRCHR